MFSKKFQEEKTLHFQFNRKKLNGTRVCELGEKQKKAIFF